MSSLLTKSSNTARQKLPLLLLVVVGGFFSLAFSLAPLVDHAAGARLDRSFGVEGVATLIPRAQIEFDDPTGALSVGRGGRILVLGNATDTKGSEDPEDQFVVGALTRIGAVDKSFGDEGFIYSSLLTHTGPKRQPFGYGEDLVQTRSRNFYVTGPMVKPGSRFLNGLRVIDCGVVARFKRSGVLDKNFGDSGRFKRCVHRDRSDRIAGLDSHSIDLGAQGEIFVGGTAMQYGNFAFVAKLKPNGTLDKRFRGDKRTASGQKGVVFILGHRFGNAYVNQVISLSGGSVLAVGSLNGSFFVAKIRSDGTLDLELPRSFGQFDRVSLNLSVRVGRGPG